MNIEKKAQALDPYQDAFHRGIAHGMAHDHPYDPHYNYASRERQAYYKGFDFGVDMKLDLKK